MANSRGGRGHIFYGVEDKTKRIIGIDSEDFEKEQIRQIIYSRRDPPVTVGVEVALWEEKTLLVLIVYQKHSLSTPNVVKRDLLCVKRVYHGCGAQK